MKTIIFFQSLIDETNKGYFVKLQKVGFLGSSHIETAKKFKNETEAKKTLDKLKEKEKNYYNFKILKGVI